MYNTNLPQLTQRAAAAFRSSGPSCSIGSKNLAPTLYKASMGQGWNQSITVPGFFPSHINIHIDYCWIIVVI